MGYCNAVHRWRGALVLAVLVLASLIPGISFSAVDRYDYDLAGRLVRRVDDQSKSTEYLYDTAGNITEVTSPIQALPPVITSGLLGDFRRNETRQVVVGGNNLTGVLIRSPHPGVVVTNIVQSASAITFRLAVAADVPLGAQFLRFENGVGAAQVGFNVVTALAFAFEPEPISVDPDGIARKFILRMGEVLPEAKTFGLGTLSSSIARSKTSQVSIPAGQTQADIGVIGVGSGNTLLRLSGGGLNEPVEFVIYVSAGAANPFFLGKAVGINKGVPWSISPSSQSISGAVGISKGVPWAVSPSAYATSGTVGIAKGLPWSTSPSNLATSGSVGVSKGVPWSVSPSAGPVIAPLVGIVKP